MTPQLEQKNWIERGTTPIERGLRRAAAFIAAIALFCFSVAILLAIAVPLIALIFSN